MVIAESDSCNTLVSLENDSKNRQVRVLGDVVRIGETETAECIPTEVLLAADEYVNEDGSRRMIMPEQCLHLPCSSSMAVDDFLLQIPQIMESCDELLANVPRHFTKASKERVLYVLQGEVAHVVPIQADVIVSDKATTCHILALCSYGASESSSRPSLTSLTHLDGTSYESSIREMFREHFRHHHHRTTNGRRRASVSEDRIPMDIHIVGGFNDKKKSSRNISCWIMNLLADIALEQKHWFKMTLRTCAISAMNDTGYSCPIGRGMGIDLRTGAAFLAMVDNDVTGPLILLRSVRIWAKCCANSTDHHQELAVIHTSASNDFCITPFAYQPFSQLDKLLKLPDHKLVKCTSTSPDVEEHDFCSTVRSTLGFLRDVECRNVFGTDVNHPLVFQRAALNAWMRIL
jgi:Protein N-terminal asparagine amidohydrolase